MFVEDVLFKQVKLLLRVSACADYDDEIKALIESAKQEFKRVGIQYDEKNQLMNQAIKIYCKANFGNHPDAQRLQERFEKEVNNMSMSDGYRGITDHTS